MSNYAQLPPAGGTEYPAIRAEVYINGTYVPTAECLWVEDCIGMLPSRAMIRLLPSTVNAQDGYDYTGCFTLTQNFKPRDRVKVVADGTTIFLGCLLKRRDMGKQNAILWEAHDDKWLLSQIPVRGCLVYDKDADSVKFISRFPMHINPGGFKNCIGANFLFGVSPVFSAYAEAGAGYDTTDYDAGLSKGHTSFWTPAKLLQYAQVLANVTAGDVAGADSDWRSIAASDRISFPVESVEFSHGSTLTMHTKLPPAAFQGKTLLALIVTALDMCGGEYGLRLRYDGDMSVCEFVPMLQNSQGVDLFIERTETLRDARSVYDFQIEHDASDVVESVLVEGAAVRVESEFSFDLDNLAGSDLVPSWNADEEYAFKRIIRGWDFDKGPVPLADTRTYIEFPSQVPDTGNTWKSVNWTLADGTLGKPMIRPNMKEAGNLARQLLPKVFRGFEIATATAWSNGKLQGVMSRYADSQVYPYLAMVARPVDPAQLQYYLDGMGRKTRHQFPIRVKVKNGLGFHDVSAQAGVQVESDGTILLDGITDGQGNRNDRLYTGDGLAGVEFIKGLYDVPGGATTSQLLPLKINCTVQLDFRAKASASALDPDVADISASIGGPTMQYVDSPNGFRVDHQVQSHPAEVLSYVGYGVAGEITNVLRDDTADALAHALRRVQQRRRLRKVSELRLVGIRPDIRAGTWVRSLCCDDGVGAVVVNAPVETFTWDFLAQESATNGMVTQAAIQQDRYDSQEQPSTAASAPLKGGSSQTKGNYTPAGEASAGKGGNYTPSTAMPTPPSHTTPAESARNQRRMADSESRQNDAGLKGNLMGGGKAEAPARDFTPKERPTSPSIKYQSPEAAARNRAESPAMDPGGFNKQAREDKMKEQATQRSAQLQEKRDAQPGARTASTTKQETATEGE